MNARFRFVVTVVTDHMINCQCKGSEVQEQLEQKTTNSELTKIVPFKMKIMEARTLFICFLCLLTFATFQPTFGVDIQWQRNGKNKGLLVEKFFSFVSLPVKENDVLISKLKSLEGELGFNSSKSLVDYFKKMFQTEKKSIHNLLFNGTSEKSKQLSKGCFDEILALVQQITRNNTSELVRMLDADGKPGSGVSEGNLAWLGSFRECKVTSFAHYCLSQMKLLGYPVELGLCVPKKCTQDDIFKILGSLAHLTNRVAKKSVIYVAANDSIAGFNSPVYCDRPTSFSTGNIAAFCVAGFFIFLVLVGTILDYLKTSFTPKKVILSKSNGFMPIKEAAEDELTPPVAVNEDQPFLAENDVKMSQGGLCTEILLCFSFRKNALQIFNTKVPSSAITCINGIRTLSMFWVILGHTFFFSLYLAADNFIEALKVTHRFSFQAIANAYFSVDSFFLLSGLLVSYLSLNRFDRYNGYSFLGYFSKKFLPQYYLHRFLRLTPSYMFVILFYIFIFPFCGQGPLWFATARGAGINDCKKYWWTNLLYINNFYPTNMGEECIGWSWYLANDMQFYIISPLILLVMNKLRVPGTLIVNAAICVASFIITGIIIGTNNLNSLLTGDFQGATNEQAQDFANWIYSKPYCRIPPYIVGLTLGYLIQKRKEPRGEAKTVISFVGWTFSIAVALAVTYGPFSSFQDNFRPFTLVENVLYGTFSRFSWGVCVAWVIYACHSGMGGIVNSILSWKIFIPLSRLTYSAYLVHPIVIYVFYNSLETPFHYSDISIVYYYTSFLVMTYASAFLLSVCVEFPASNLEKLSFRF